MNLCHYTIIRSSHGKSRFDEQLFSKDGSFLLAHTTKHPEGKFLVAKFEFGGSFGMSLEGNCHDVEVTPNLEVLVTFGMSLEGVCDELYTYFHYKLILNLEVTRNS
jgi:hypothetical protein